MEIEWELKRRRPDGEGSAASQRADDAKWMSTPWSLLN
jgi:hypothetical protein